MLGRALGRLSVVGLWLAGGCAGCSAPPAPAGNEHAHAHVNEHEHEQGVPPSAAEAGLVRIAEPGHVCMLSNRFLGEKQHVPVEVEGKTYFGCCAGCAAKLGVHPEARVAADPVTGRTLDKATAVLARDERGKVSYFESEATLARARDRR